MLEGSKRLPAAHTTPEIEVGDRPSSTLRAHNVTLGDSAAHIEPGDTASIRVLKPGKVEINVVPRMKLAEALERHRIDGAVDIAGGRFLWQETADEDVLGRADG